MVVVVVVVAIVPTVALAVITVEYNTLPGALRPPCQGKLFTHGPRFRTDEIYMERRFKKKTVINNLLRHASFLVCFDFTEIPAGGDAERHWRRRSRSSASCAESPWWPCSSRCCRCCSAIGYRNVSILKTNLLSTF